MVHLTPFFIKLKNCRQKPLFTFCYIRDTGDIIFVEMKKICPLRIENCKMFQQIRCLECTFSILVLADLDNMSLGYLYFIFREDEGARLKLEQYADKDQVCQTKTKIHNFCVTFDSCDVI